MQRRWNAKRIVDRCQLVADTLSQPAFTTDAIVGFPGETEADFQQTLDVCQQIGFSKIHIFPFSRRKGTPAATMANQVSPEDKAARVERLASVEALLRASYFQQLQQRRLKVLVESIQEGQAMGTSCRYAPVAFSVQGLQSGVAIGNFVEVQVSGMGTERLTGIPVNAGLLQPQ
jgi:threonylcarbamoyladenosine tRNA methylthiotransferase MtaB